MCPDLGIHTRRSVCPDLGIYKVIGVPCILVYIQGDQCALYLGIYKVISVLCIWVYTR